MEHGSGEDWHTRIPSSIHGRRRPFTGTSIGHDHAPSEDLRDMRSGVRVAGEMGASLGRGSLLFPRMSTRPASERPRTRTSHRRASAQSGPVVDDLPLGGCPDRRWRRMAKRNGAGPACGSTARGCRCHRDHPARPRRGPVAGEGTDQVAPGPLNELLADRFSTLSGWGRVIPPSLTTSLPRLQSGQPAAQKAARSPWNTKARAVGVHRPDRSALGVVVEVPGRRRPNSETNESSPTTSRTS